MIIITDIIKTMWNGIKRFTLTTQYVSVIILGEQIINCSLLTFTIPSPYFTLAPFPIHSLMQSELSLSNNSVAVSRPQKNKRKKEAKYRYWTRKIMAVLFSPQISPNLSLSLSAGWQPGAVWVTTTHCIWYKIYMK